MSSKIRIYLFLDASAYFFHFFSAALVISIALSLLFTSAYFVFPSLPFLFIQIYIAIIEFIKLIILY
jgi:hypothetical protein